MPEEIRAAEPTADYVGRRVRIDPATKRPSSVRVDAIGVVQFSERRNAFDPPALVGAGVWSSSHRRLAG